MGRRRVREADESEAEEQDQEETEPKRGRTSAGPKKKAREAEEQSVSVDVAKLQRLRKPSSQAYTDIHRSFLQYMMFVKCQEASKLEDVARKLGSTIPLNEFVDEINSKLLSSDMSIKIGARDMVDMKHSRRVYALVNTKSDEVAKKSTLYEPWELVLMSHCVKLLAESETGFFSHTQAIHAASEVSKTGNAVLQTLRSFVSRGWLSNAQRKNYFTAGSRMLLELGHLLRESGAQQCPISKQTVMRTSYYKEWAQQHKVDET